MRFFQEYATRHHAGSEPNPFIIVELGAGTGMFAFYLIKKLLELRASLKRPDLTFKYIMTDFSAKNIAFWRDHPALRQYVQYGDEEMLDYNLEGSWVWFGHEPPNDQTRRNADYAV